MILCMLRKLVFSSPVLYSVRCLSIDHVTGSKLRDVRKVEGIGFFYLQLKKLQSDLIIDNTLVTAI